MMYMLDELILDLEHAMEPSRELDERIVEMTRYTNIRGARQATGYAGLSKLTTSLEAAQRHVGIILPDWGRMSYWNNCQGHLAQVEDNADRESTGESYEGYGCTAGIALCVAMLRALKDHQVGEAAKQGQP